MASSAEGWLSAAVYRIRACPTPDPPTEVRFRDLPPQKKRELASLTLGGIAWTAALLVPLMLLVPESIPLPAASLPMQLAAAPALSRVAPVQIAVTPVAVTPARAPRARRPVVSNAFLKTERLPVAPAGQLTTRASDEPGPAAKPVQRNLLARVFLGDGHARPRPFPVPATRTDW